MQPHQVHTSRRVCIRYPLPVHSSPQQQGVKHVATFSTHLPIAGGCAPGSHIQYTPANSRRLCTSQPRRPLAGARGCAVGSQIPYTQAGGCAAGSHVQHTVAVGCAAGSHVQYKLVAGCAAGSHIQYTLATSSRQPRPVHTSHQQGVVQQVATSSTGTGKTWQRGQIRSVKQLNSLLTKNCIGMKG